MRRDLRGKGALGLALEILARYSEERWRQAPVQCSGQNQSVSVGTCLVCLSVVANSIWPWLFWNDEGVMQNLPTCTG